MDFIEYRKQDMKKDFISTIKRIIAESCGCNGQNYKMKIPLSDLIDYKHGKSKYSRWNLPTSSKPDSSSELLQKFVGAIDKIVEYTKAAYPYIDLTGIDLNYTAEEILGLAIIAYDNCTALTLEQLKLIRSK